MNLLTIETTGPLASAAISNGTKLISKVNNTQYSHLEEIVPMVRSLLAENGIDPSALDAIAVSEGPGSFTGLRIGMATVKGLAQIWNKPVVQVPTLAAFAFGEYAWLDADKRYLICPVFDARRSQVYAAAYPYGSDAAVIEGAPYALPDYLSLLQDSSVNYDEVIFFGDGSHAYHDMLDGCKKEHRFAPEEDCYQLAANDARLAMKLFAEGKTCSCYDCEPNYMREAEAERKRREKNGG